MSRMPWAQRPMRGSQAARECALAAEQILGPVVADPNQLDRILNMIEVSINQHLRQMPEAQNTGFDPVSGAPSRRGRGRDNPSQGKPMPTPTDRIPLQCPGCKRPVMYSATRAIEAERAGRPLFVFCSRRCNQL